MPTYRYRCSECGEEFELWQSIKDDAIRTHDDGCGGEVLKVLTAAGIVLKGAGFYKTDSRSASKSKGSDGSQPKDDGGSSEPKPSPSSDSGAATKSGDATSTPTKTGDSKSTAGAAKPS